MRFWRWVKLYENGQFHFTPVIITFNPNTMKISNWTKNIAKQTNNDLDWTGFMHFVAKTYQSRITRFWGNILKSNCYLWHIATLHWLGCQVYRCYKQKHPIQLLEYFNSSPSSSLWCYLGNEKSYQRSAGGKTTGFLVPFQIFKREKESMLLQILDEKNGWASEGALNF